MADIDIDGALLKLDLLIDRTSNAGAKADLQACRTIICQLQQSQIASYAVLRKVDTAIDAASDIKRPLIKRVRDATRAPDGTEAELWAYLADWTEMVSSAEETSHETG